MILTPLQKLPNNVGNLGKIIVTTGFECLPKVQKSPNLVTLPSILNLIKVCEAHSTKFLPQQIFQFGQNSVSSLYGDQH